ncbi:MAG: PilZ domain-containing protein [Deltaproteobacteria bacterium]|nr:PilZ domain-containing protein [Deltaproteobacteria bacterium]MBW2537506.1 PilZ domain-containing protein [Deltaproteobacteria bacterium]
MAEDRPEQRRHPRQLVLIPAYVGAERDSTKGFGLVRNISLDGAFFLTQRELRPGDELDITLHLTGDPAGPVRPVRSKVVRVEALDPDTTDLWFWGVGVSFHEALSDIEDEIAQLAEKLADAQ